MSLRRYARLDHARDMRSFEAGGATRPGEIALALLTVVLAHRDEHRDGDALARLLLRAGEQRARIRDAHERSDMETMTEHVARTERQTGEQTQSNGRPSRQNRERHEV